MFSALQLTGFFLRGLLTAAIPFAVFFYLRKRQGGRAMPVLAGAVTVMLILIPRALLRSILVQGAETLTGKWLTVWLIGAACEELGRYLTMRHAIPQYDSVTDALCYGIGHGGTEVIMTARNQFVLLADALHGNGSAEHLNALMHQGFLTAADIILGSAANLAFHMALSVLIARAVHYENCKKLIPIAVFIHMLMNFTDFCFGTAAGILLTVLLCIIVRLHGKQFTGGTI